MQINKKEDGTPEANPGPTPGKTATPLNRRASGAPGILAGTQSSNEAKSKKPRKPTANGSAQPSLQGSTQKARSNIKDPLNQANQQFSSQPHEVKSVSSQ